MLRSVVGTVSLHQTGYCERERGSVVSCHLASFDGIDPFERSGMASVVLEAE